MSASRIPPVEPPFSPAVTAALGKIMPPGVPPLCLFRVLAVNERVFLRAMAGGLLDRGSISLRDREIVIHRTTARLGSEYEWGVHAAFFAAKAGLGDTELAATASRSPGARPGAAPLPERDQLLFSLVDGLVDTATVTDSLWEQLSAVWTAEQLVELVALVGFYHLISFTANAFRVPLEPFAARFPEDR